MFRNYRLELMEPHVSSRSTEMIDNVRLEHGNLKACM